MKKTARSTTTDDQDPEQTSKKADEKKEQNPSQKDEDYQLVVNIRGSWILRKLFGIVRKSMSIKLAPAIVDMWDKLKNLWESSP